MSDKNRIKRLRKITVNNEKYVWLVDNFNGDGDYNCWLNIWKDRKKIYCKKVEETITPKIVEEKILNLLAR